MGMIQIDMPMPEKCGVCPCFHFENPMYCQAVKADKNKKIVNPYGSPRPEWCPLNEQEPVKPIRMYHSEHKQTDNYRCGKCGDDIYFEQRFCECCGQAVKWDE